MKCPISNIQNNYIFILTSVWAAVVSPSKFAVAVCEGTQLANLHKV
jgi:hypothetical protein